MKTLACLLLGAMSLAAEEKVDLNAVHRIRMEALENSKVMDHAFYLSDVYGPRLTGSPGLKAAADWAVKRLGEFGLLSAQLEKWGPFGRGWSNVRFAAHLKEPVYAPLIGFARPWSPGTAGSVSGDPILAVMRTEADFAKFKGKLKGKIVLIDAARAISLLTNPLARVYSDAELMNESMALTASANSYAGRAGQAAGAPPASRESIARFRDKLNKFLTDEGAAIVISHGDRTDGGTVRATAAGSRNGKDPLPPPSVAMTPEHYNRIVRLVDRKIPVTLEFDIQNRFHEDTQDSFNVVAEIPGTDKKDEVVMLGAHLDSWTGGTGATDNAAGSSVAIEVVRVLKAAGLQPRRTVRIALWTGEEQGLLGSRAYVKEHFADRETMELKPSHSKVAGYFNLDNGSGKIRGVYLQGNDMVRPVFEAWLAPFKDMGASTITIRNTSGTDHLSFDAVGLPGFQFVQDPLEYGTRTHHTNMDVYDRLQRDHLAQASAIMASFVYLAAIRDEMLPRKPLPKARPEPGMKKDVPFTKVGDVTLALDAYVPEGEGPFPAVIVVHGGGWVNGNKQSYVQPLFDPLTKGGFSWFTIDYRLAPQYRYPAAVEDVEAAIRYVRANAKRYKVDPDKIAIMGESAGGHLVSLVGARSKPDTKVAAVVSFYGVHDFEAREVPKGKPTEPVEKFLGVTDLSPKSLKIMREASPLTYVKAGMPPYLLIHGTKDAQVPYEQSPMMCDKIKQAGASCELFTVPDAPHGVGPWEKVPEFQAYKEKMVEWLKATLK